MNFQIGHFYLIRALDHFSGGSSDFGHSGQFFVSGVCEGEYVSEGIRYVVLANWWSPKPVSKHEEDSIKEISVIMYPAIVEVWDLTPKSGGILLKGIPPEEPDEEGEDEPEEVIVAPPQKTVTLAGYA